MQRFTILLLSVCVASSLSATGVAEGDDTAMESLTIGVMPAVDAAPIFLASRDGYFDLEGVSVEIQLFTNAQDRQSALQAQAIDGAMTDLVAVAVNVAAGFDIRATTLTDGVFPILAAPGTTDEESVTVGLMEISVTNFLVDQWLGDYDVRKVYINAIPARLEAVVSGQIDMGIFPEPVASAGALQGLEKLLFEPVGGFSPDVMVFTGTALAEKNAQILAFHRAYDRAVTAIQADPELARDILLESIPNMSEALRETMDLPVYHPARLPDEAYLQRIIDWTREVVGGTLDVTPAEMVEGRFVN